ncbi:MFS transporter [Streptococcus caprae]|uniref:MFS transporter n=1 Tax=Streptococcus caprae TaxID=1640501 RepID=A0ABV8CUV7_9STRE
MAFFTCGFHMSIIETHLHSQYISYGFSPRLVAFAFSIYGIAAVLGSIGSGVLLNYFNHKWVLASIYASRLLIPALLLVLPKTVFLVYVTAFLFGLTGNATVPPTSSLIIKEFGPKALGALFGIAYLFHQFGAFVSSWLGGILLEVTHSYNLIWFLAMVLSLSAAGMIAQISQKEESSI